MKNETELLNRSLDHAIQIIKDYCGSHDTCWGCRFRTEPYGQCMFLSQYPVNWEVLSDEKSDCN